MESKNERSTSRDLSKSECDFLVLYASSSSVAYMGDFDRVKHYTGCPKKNERKVN